MSTAGVIVVIYYHARADHLTDAVRELSSLIETVVATEPDCLGIRLHQRGDDPARILLWEHWTSQDAFVGPHQETPHLQAFRKRLPELFVGPPDVTFWTLAADAAR